MVLGALIDAGLPEKFLVKELRKLNLRGYEIKISKAGAGLAFATKIDVKTKGEDERRTLKDIQKIINSSKLSSSVKSTAGRIFTRLAEAESKVHKMPVEKLHFHELGSTDAVIDIVGCSIGMEKLGIKKVFSSALNAGRGRVITKHGTFSIPAPATAQLLKGVPVFSNDIPGELVTPTGAAIITTLCRDFGNMPRIKIGKTGSGMGSYKLRTPNILTVVVGDADLDFEEDTIVQIETNIDNMNPEFYNYAIARIMKAGALDAYVTPITMKKGRPAVTLSALSPINKKDAVIKTILSETTSLGVRQYLMKRKKLKREFLSVKTKYGIASVKIGSMGTSLANVSPEYADIEKLAKKNRVPLKTIYQEVIKNLPGNFRKQISKNAPL